MIAQVRIPRETAALSEEGAGFGAASKDKRFRIETEIPHEGEVNRARYMPLQYNVIATNTNSGEVHIFDYFKHPTKPLPQDQPRPELRLMGNDREGYGLAWNPSRRGVVASGSNNGRICLWDIEAATQVGARMDALEKFEAHTGAVEDVAWHRFHNTILASVGDDRRLSVWDTRQNSRHAIKSVEAHAKDVSALDFNPFNEYLLATASADRTVGIWDLRNLGRKVYSLNGHTDDVTGVSWAPFKESVLMSSSDDRRILVWDLAHVGAEQTVDEAKEGPPELLFAHGGHTSKVLDMSWNRYEEYVVASVSFDNDIQIWQIVFMVR